eukprot:2420488-Amphidinium_carterae.1
MSVTVIELHFSPDYYALFVEHGSVAAIPHQRRPEGLLPVVSNQCKRVVAPDYIMESHQRGTGFPELVLPIHRLGAQPELDQR